MEEDQLRVDATLDTDASGAEVLPVTHALNEAGLEAKVSASFETKELAADVEWLVLLIAYAYLKPLLRRLAELHAEDAHAALKGLVKRLTEARRHSARRPGVPVLRSEKENLEIRLDAGLADHAIEKLLEGEFPDQTESGQLVYDTERQCWRDPWGRHWRGAATSSPAGHSRAGTNGPRGGAAGR